MNYEITEEQIKELAKANAKVKKWFPEVFESKLEVGKWYKSDYPLLIYIEEIHHHKLVGYGFNSINEFSETTDFCTRANENNKVDYDKFNFRLATNSEVEEALTNEAKKRGFLIGSYFINFHGGIQQVNDLPYLEGTYHLHVSSPHHEWFKDNCNSNPIIFKDGVWATPIKTYTKEEAEKLLNAKII